MGKGPRKATATPEASSDRLHKQQSTIEVRYEHYFQHARAQAARPQHDFDRRLSSHLQNRHYADNVSGHCQACCVVVFLVKSQAGVHHA